MNRPARWLRLCAIGSSLTAGVIVGGAVVSGVQPEDNRLKLEGFVIAQDTSSQEAFVPGQTPSADAVRKILGADWVVVTAADGRVELKRSVGATTQEAAGPTKDLTLGEAWDRAHQLTRAPGVRYAEPTVTLDANHGEGEAPDEYCPPCAPHRDKTAACHSNIGGALANSDWSLDGEFGANVKAAWKLFDDLHASPGAGVVIGHPDTGFRFHPEIWSDNRPEGDLSGVHPEFGWNFLTSAPWDPENRESGPFDPLLDGFLRNPGHGTKTASVMVSPPGSNFPNGSPRWVSGVAPGATLIPLRVAEGVVLFPGDIGQLHVDVARLATAIREASGENREHVKRRVDIISISMGGLPGTRDLADAVEFAEQHGVIVIAAAGNQLPDRRVVFPANFGPVVAVAASNYDGRAWECSSRGSKVAVTAPGESVWTAASRPNQNCVNASDGTSFATATMAGIAALWLSYPEQAHKAATDKLRGSRQLPAAFREVLKHAARPSKLGPKGFGAGLVDASALITAPIPTISATKEALSGTTWCPGANASAFRALEGIFRDVPDGRARSNRLLQVADLCEAPGEADEVAFWYSIDNTVASSFRDLVSARTVSASDFARARKAILKREPSPQLRARLSSVQ
jgi:hypothetical protein